MGHGVKLKTRKKCDDDSGGSNQEIFHVSTPQ